MRVIGSPRWSNTYHMRLDRFLAYLRDGGTRPSYISERRWLAMLNWHQHRLMYGEPFYFEYPKVY
jgi:hypothetical protein